MTKLKKVIEGLDTIWCIIEREMYADMAIFADNAIALLKEQETIIEQYRRANEFLAAHDWKDGEEG